MSNAQNIVKIATQLASANLVEIQPNKGWKPNAMFPDFQKEMIALGWNIGDEWCADSATWVWHKGCTPEVFAIARKHLSPNSQQTAKNFHADVTWPTSTNVPTVGAICVWQAGDSLIMGHEGIVVWVSEDGKTFKSAEGNTSSTTQPDIRTGWTYAIHTHTVGLPHSHLGLNLDRFVYALDSYEPLVLSV